MSHYCKSHPRFEGKSIPKSICGDCWHLYFIRNPEDKERLQGTYADAEKLRAHVMKS